MLPSVHKTPKRVRIGVSGSDAGDNSAAFVSSEEEEQSTSPKEMLERQTRKGRSPTKRGPKSKSPSRSPSRTSRSGSPINAFKEWSPAQRRPYTTQGKIAQVFDASYSPSRGGEGWRQSERRVQSTGKGTYWRHKTLKSMAVGPRPNTSSSRFDEQDFSDPPPHLEHWVDLHNPVEIMEFLKSYSQRYKDKPPGEWTERDVFSFVADSFSAPEQVDASGARLPMSRGQFENPDSRLDTLVLRCIRRHRLTYKKMLFWGTAKTARSLHIPKTKVVELISGIEQLGYGGGSNEEDDNSASAAMLAARRDAKDVATVEAFMLAEVALRREKARLAEVKQRLEPMEHRMQEQMQDVEAIREHELRTAWRDATRARTAGASSHSPIPSRSNSRPPTSGSSFSTPPRPATHTPERGRPKSSRDALSAMKRELAADLMAKAAAVETLAARAEEINQGLRAKEDAALASREQMRRMERERNSTSAVRRKEEEEKENEARVGQQAQLESADEMLDLAETRLGEAGLCEDMESRFETLQGARRAFDEARGGYTAADAIGARLRRLTALERLLDLEFSKRADGDMHLRIARKHIDSIEIHDTNPPKASARLLHEKTIKAAKGSVKKARSEYKRTGALEDAMPDIHKVENLIEKAVEYINRPESEAVAVAVAEDGHVEVKKEEDEWDSEKADPEQQALFHKQLHELIQLKKTEAMSNISDSLYGMQAWLYRARRRPSTSKRRASPEPPAPTPSMTAAHSETSTRPTSAEAASASGLGPHKHTPVSGPG